MSEKTILVRRYKTDPEYQKDANKLARDGYTVTSTTSEQPRSGCLRILTLGILFKPKPVLVVTYSQAPQPAQTAVKGSQLM